MVDIISVNLYAILHRYNLSMKFTSLDSLIPFATEHDKQVSKQKRQGRNTHTPDRTSLPGHPSVFQLSVKGIREDIMEEKSGFMRCWPCQSRYRGRSRSLERRGGASRPDSGGIVIVIYDGIVIWFATTMYGGIDHLIYFSKYHIPEGINWTAAQFTCS